MDGKTRRMNKVTFVVVALIASWLPHAAFSRENILKSLQSGGGNNRTGKAGPPVCLKSVTCSKHWLSCHDQREVGKMRDLHINHLIKSYQQDDNLEDCLVVKEYR